MKRIVVIIQARMGSTRLQGKVMMDIYGKSVLAHDIERIRQAKLVEDIVIATTASEKDLVIVDEAIKCGVKVYRGSEEDVLSRYYEAAVAHKADIVVRITSDCPLIDPFIIDEIIQCYLDNSYDLVTNAGNEEYRTYPRGLDVEVFSFAKLEEANRNGVKSHQREHVTPYIYENSKNIFYYMNDVDFSKYRWTLDTEEDFRFINEIYKYLYNNKHDFYFNDILRLLESKPNLIVINSHIEQKKITGQ